MELNRLQIVGKGSVLYRMLHSVLQFLQISQSLLQDGFVCVLILVAFQQPSGRTLLSYGVSGTQSIHKLFQTLFLLFNCKDASIPLHNNCNLSSEQENGKTEGNT